MALSIACCVNILTKHYKSKGFAPEFMKAMTLYEWPGNVRELINTIERVLASAPFELTLFHYHLPTHIRVKMVQSLDDSKEEPGITPIPYPSLEGLDSEHFPILKDFRESQEKHYLQKLLSVVNNNKNEAYRISGLSRSRFYDLMKKYDL